MFLAGRDVLHFICLLNSGFHPRVVFLKSDELYRVSAWVLMRDLLDRTGKSCHLNGLYCTSLKIIIHISINLFRSNISSYCIFQLSKLKRQSVSQWPFDLCNSFLPDFLSVFASVYPFFSLLPLATSCFTNYWSFDFWPENSWDNPHLHGTGWVSLTKASRNTVPWIKPRNWNRHMEICYVQYF